MHNGAGGAPQTIAYPDINFLISIKRAIASNPFQPFFSITGNEGLHGKLLFCSICPSRRATVRVPSWHSADPPLGGAGGRISEAPFRRAERSEATLLDTVEISERFFYPGDFFYGL
jgi:hypothetical protein